jgi:hypothetical protein
VVVSATLTTAPLVQAADAVSWGTVAALERGALGMPVDALFAKKKKKKKPAKKGPLLSPESADEKRDAIREAAQADLDVERWSAAADTLESNAAILGDPVTFLEAGEARLKHADAERSIDDAQRAIETTLVALDILHFYRSVASGQASSEWLVINPDAAGSYIARAEEQLDAAQTLIEEIERERAGGDGIAAGPDAPKKKKDRSLRPGTGMIAGGAVATAVGVAGITMVIAGVAIGGRRQGEVEDLMPGIDDEEIERLDGEGARANRLAFIGTGIAVVGLAVGIPLIALGVKKRRAGSSTTAHMQVLPAMGPHLQGLTLSGRF